MSQFFNKRFSRWLSQRIPAAERHQLSRKNIFILPTRFGFSYLGFVFLLFLLATNYQNNIIMLLSYFLSSVFITAMMLSFYNLSGLKVTAQAKHHSFAEQVSYVAITLHKDSKQDKRFALELLFENTLNHSKLLPIEQVKVVPVHDKTLVIDVPYFFDRRGRYSPGRIKISSQYCLGLFVSWTRLDFGFETIVFPKSHAFNEKLLSSMNTRVDNDAFTGKHLSHMEKGNDDFHELKKYVLGEPISTIAWKQLAKGQGKLTKHYQKNESKLNWLILDNIPVNSLETKLSILCYLVLEYDNNGQEYGLDLGQLVIEPALGEAHKIRCLTALADF